MVRCRVPVPAIEVGDIAHVLHMWNEDHMAKMIQVRNVPDRLHREITRRARRQGRTVTAYVQEILEREVARPPLDETLERIARRGPVDLGQPAAELIREERAAREGR